MPLAEAKRPSVRPQQPLDMSVPDLDLGPPVAKLPSLAPPPPMAQPRPNPSASTSSMAAVSADFDPFEDDPVESLELEIADVVEKRPPVSEARPLKVPASDALAARSSSGVVPVEAVEVDRYEALALADFGPVPTRIWETPGYAMRVVLRRRQLAGEARLLARELELKEKAWLDALVALVDAIRPALEAHPDGARWLAPIAEIEERARARGDALETTSSEFAGKVAEIDREIAVAEEAYDVEVTKLEPITAELERRKSELSRAEAMLKRMDIEIRAAQQAAMAAAGPDATVAPPEHARKLAALSEERSLRAEDVARAKADLDEVRRPHQAQEKKLGDKRRQIADLRKRRRSLEDTYSRQLSVRGQGVVEAEREKREITIEIGKRLLVESPVPIDEGARKGAEVAQKALLTTRGELEKHTLACDLYEREPFKRGWMVLGAGLLLLVLFVLWLGWSGGEPA